MRRGWSIGEHRIEVEINAMILTVRVDGARAPALALRSNLVGSWQFTAGPRLATLRRVRSIDVLRTEVEVEGVRIPPSRDAIAWVRANHGATCKFHPSASATIECGTCRDPVGTECMAADHVRCRVCFEQATDQMLREDRANRIKGPAAAVALIVAIGLYGLIAHSLPALQIAAGAAVLCAILVVRGLIRERIEARAVPAAGVPGHSPTSRTTRPRS